MYLTKTPFWLRAIYPTCTWRIDTREKKLYLTFDDGPHPVATTFVLEQLAKYNAKATFFCIGKNVQAHPKIYQQIINCGHQIGNHTQTHLNGWNSHDADYIENIAEAKKQIHSNLFRPPYGRIKKSQIRMLQSQNELPNQIIMWDVLSGDFDKNKSGKDCAETVIKKSTSGSIVVFHDSEKAWENVSVALPRVLAHFSAVGYSFDILPFK
jgi:peptidoglycan/xylan/chitin deacetylase (PgdA/CDA1 family)